LTGNRSNGHGPAESGASGIEASGGWTPDVDDDIEDEPDEGEDPPFPEEPEMAQTIEERIAEVLADVEGLERRSAGEATELLVGGRLFARTGDGWIEAALDPPVARVAIRTPDVTASERGQGWIRFVPSVPDRFALDRVEAWLRSSYRRARGG
jgi:hypothetical protein